MSEAKQHYHEAFYEEGELTRKCAKCGKDLMHDSHIRQQHPVADRPQRG